MHADVHALACRGSDSRWALRGAAINVVPGRGVVEDVVVVDTVDADPGIGFNDSETITSSTINIQDIVVDGRGIIRRDPGIGRYYDAMSPAVGDGVVGNNIAVGALVGECRRRMPG